MEELLHLAEVSRVTGVSIYNLKKAAKERKIRHFLINDRVKFSKMDLQVIKHHFTPEVIPAKKVDVEDTAEGE